ncbi:hypothetical protein A2866_01845 [Candidatus Roizmanbacteria bacterium RIFCSPHIGHO2_01_FULL_39_8]|uniref:Uncharacterized protein n=1 Tax=Candidatus Roizmanbacteria bacterium RIFCSPHIGHO2_01_FULL_39_8 TaxID=1802033 RepID=A0A1F7GQ68_9BACT|nr:MAG: hypothetical protein A2866_01845 [Candidatus Roizmanbacteria bacterium RIFCSPHIGHO2_01_FULL_39_8]
MQQDLPVIKKATEMYVRKMVKKGTAKSIQAFAIVKIYMNQLNAVSIIPVRATVSLTARIVQTVRLIAWEVSVKIMTLHNVV